MSEFGFETLTQVFEETARKHGTRIAAVIGKESITYEMLNAKANCLANKLLEYGVENEEIIAVQMPRSIELMITLVAIHKAGCAYMPIDTECPQDRMQFLIDDSGTKILIRKEGLPEFGGRIERLFTVNEQSIGNDYSNLSLQFGGDNIAYVIYTSGSTGMPKGAMIEHKSVLNRLYWMKKTYGITEKDRILQKTPYTFDVSVWELFLSFFTAGTLYLAEPKTENDPNTLANFIDQNMITVCHFIPSMLSALLRYLMSSNRVNCLRTIRVLCCSGESLGYELVMLYQKQLRDKYGTRLFNLYGPTEATVDVTSFDCTYWQSVDGIVPIGFPIDNTNIYILDEHMNQCSEDQPGELYIAGINVGRGYLNRAELTAERFLEDIGGSGGKMFRTGDIAKYGENGCVIFMGRLDNQLKVRGMRVEPEEIESAIIQNVSGVTKVVVSGLKRDCDKNVLELCAVYEGSMETEREKEYAYGQLLKKLSEYMVPKIWIKLVTIPVLSNGKVDRKAVEKLINRKIETKPNFIERNIENEIVAAIKEELHSIFQNQFSMEKSLQEAGIDSLSFMTIIVKLEDQFDIRFDSKMLVYSRIDSVQTLVRYTENLISRKRGD